MTSSESASLSDRGSTDDVMAGACDVFGVANDVMTSMGARSQMSTASLQQRQSKSL